MKIYSHTMTWKVQKGKKYKMVSDEKEFYIGDGIYLKISEGLFLNQYILYTSKCQECCKTFLYDVNLAISTTKPKEK